MQDGARRRLLFREVNKAIRSVSVRNGLVDYHVFCECERAECGARIDVPASLYEDVLAGERFVVVPGHEEGASGGAAFIPLGRSTESADAVSAA
jgi:hypothetical protein